MLLKFVLIPIYYSYLFFSFLASANLLKLPCAFLLKTMNILNMDVKFLSEMMQISFEFLLNEKTIQILNGFNS